jgi:YggT family protein
VGPFLSYWYYYLPDYALAAVMYTLLGRVALSQFLEQDSPNYIWRFFCRITDPAIAVVAQVTPKAAAPIVLWLFSFVWLFWLRFALRVLYTGAGLIPAT